VLIAAPACLEEALPQPSPHDSLRHSQFGRHFFIVNKSAGADCGSSTQQ
jgi:hypothetical protein